MFSKDMAVTAGSLLLVTFFLQITGQIICILFLLLFCCCNNLFCFCFLVVLIKTFFAFYFFVPFYSKRARFKQPVK